MYTSNDKINPCHVYKLEISSNRTTIQIKVIPKKPRDDKQLEAKAGDSIVIEVDIKSLTLDNSFRSYNFRLVKWFVLISRLYL